MAARPGVIERGAVYTLLEFRLRAGLTDSAFKQARRAGLRVHRVHKRGYVFGDDWLEYLQASARPGDSAAQSR